MCREGYVEIPRNDYEKLMEIVALKIVREREAEAEVVMPLKTRFTSLAEYVKRVSKQPKRAIAGAGPIIINPTRGKTSYAELEDQCEWLVKNRQILITDFNTERKNLLTKIECLTGENRGLVNQLNDEIAEHEDCRGEMYELAEYVHNPCGSCNVEKMLDIEIRQSNILKREVEMYKDYSEGLKYQLLNGDN